MTKQTLYLRGAGAIAVAAAILLAGCSSGDQGGDANPVVSVQVAPVSRGAIQQWVSAQAVLYPLQQAVITPKISAPVAELYVKRGDRVHAGQLLARLENKDLEAAAQDAQGQLQTAQANYKTATAGTIPADLKKAQLDVTAAKQAMDNAQKIYDGRQGLFQQGAIPRRDLDQAGVDLTNAKNAYELAQEHLQSMQSGGHAQELQAAHGDLQSAEAKAAAAEAQLSYSEIRSPIDGVVTDRPVYAGELATPSAPIMTIMNLSEVVARAALPADQASLLKVGDTATLSVPGSDQPVPARVSVVSPATDPGSTTIQVWAQARNPNDSLRPGTSVQVAMLARTLPDAITVPASAILSDTSGATSVMVVGADNKAHETDVTTGVSDNGRVQILKGLQVGQKVVSEGAYGLPDQAQVKIVAPPPPGQGDQDKD